MEKILRLVEKFIPKKIYKLGQPFYHYSLALLGALIYRFPSRKIKVVAITGTKGKTSTVEFVNTILEAAGFVTATASTLRFKIKDSSKPNMYKMTMPGRFFIQRFLRQAVNAKCDYAVIEISSEAAKQYRHKFIELDALLFTNLAPEHIESHGSYENYVAAKLSIAKALENSSKKNRVIIANIDDKEGKKFLNINVEKKIPYSLKDAVNLQTKDDGLSFTFGQAQINSKLVGQFNAYNMLAAATYAKAIGLEDETIKIGLENLSEIKGRGQKIPNHLGIEVVIDYAHTSDSLKALYEAFLNKNKICVFGGCGGGRDKWKRKEMAHVAENYCSEIILTDEDPYDDDPQEIVESIAREFTKKKPKIILDRREAIAEALRLAKPGDAVLITGKGTDPYIMRAHGHKEPWSDALVVAEEISKMK